MNGGRRSHWIVVFALGTLLLQAGCLDGVNYNLPVEPAHYLAETELPHGYPGQPYSGTISLMQDPGQPVEWSVVEGFLAFGLELQPSTGPTVEIKGTPTFTFDYFFTISARPGIDPPAVREFVLHVDRRLIITSV